MKHSLDDLDDSLELSVLHDWKTCICTVFVITFSCSEGHDTEAGSRKAGPASRGSWRGGEGAESLAAPAAKPAVLSGTSSVAVSAVVV